MHQVQSSLLRKPLAILGTQRLPVVVTHKFQPISRHLKSLLPECAHEGGVELRDQVGVEGVGRSCTDPERRQRRW